MASRSKHSLDFPNLQRFLKANETLRPQHVAEAHLSTDSRNRLIYELKSESRQDRLKPKSLILEGAWGLSDQHELTFTMRSLNEGPSDTLVLRGALADAQANRLVFALEQSGQDSNRPVQHIHLSGRWAADPKNRLTFLIDKGNGSEDVLTLQGGWEVGRHHALIYRYRGRQKSAGHTLTFEGAWEINQAHRLTYRLRGSDDSAFEFTAALQSPSLTAAEGKIVYQVGIECRQGQRLQRKVTLFGKWKLGRHFATAFEMDYGTRVERMHFEATAILNARDRIAVALSHGQRNVGLRVTFTRQFLRDAKFFLQLRKDARENALIGGVQVRF
ncbi:MAG: hypothetical protein HYY57_07115 [Candidatus Omnitrophica bacterium]|nr:hypothetical protein [Candidatus Omnitrophota bacterium]